MNKLDGGDIVRALEAFGFGTDLAFSGPVWPSGVIPTAFSDRRSGPSYGASSPIMIWPHPQPKLTRVPRLWRSFLMIFDLCALGGSCQWLLGEHNEDLFREAGCWVAGFLCQS